MFLTSGNPGKVIWGFGPIFSFPTATNDALTTGQFALGVDFVVLDDARQVGDRGRDKPDVAHRRGRQHDADQLVLHSAIHQLQPASRVVDFHRPNITADWNAPSGQQWTVPLGLGVSKVDRIGKQPVNLSLQYYHNVVRPDNGPSDVVRMVFALLYPVARAK